MDISFSHHEHPQDGAVCVYVIDPSDESVESFFEALSSVFPDIKGVAETFDFKGKKETFFSYVLHDPQEGDPKRIVAWVLGEGDHLPTFEKSGGLILERVMGAHEKYVVVDDAYLDPAYKAKWGAQVLAHVALGIQLGAYRFDKYKSKREEDDKACVLEELQLRSDEETIVELEDLWPEYADLIDSVNWTRNLVNEPANVLTPQAFAHEVLSLHEQIEGLSVRIIDARVMKGSGMNALLAVGQGSDNESALAVLEWKGAEMPEGPLMFAGKGVCFDSGGISIKPAKGMESMKGDMAGAACVAGVMRYLAKRRARVHAVGLLGLVENMPSSKAQRPGDVVVAMSGKTIEVLNTDAEGRMVLADVLTYGKETFNPRLIVDLATLTGAILVALGSVYAGLFSNDDDLSNRLVQAGESVGEKLWRMPMGEEYHKMIVSKVADIQNVGSKGEAGSITAAQFLKCFVDDTPWAHIDIAGTAIDSPQTPTNKSWGSGYGVRLLDALVRQYETETSVTSGS